jgi:arsenate reductase (glutaredoxin)
MSNQITLLYYSKCGTCRKAEKWLKDKGVKFEYRQIKEANPTAEELSQWIGDTGLPVAKFFNTSGLLYKEQNMKDKVKVLSQSALIDILASDGMMVKRPIALVGNKVLVGFKEEEWNEII